MNHKAEDLDKKLPCPLLQPSNDENAPKSPKYVPRRMLLSVCSDTKCYHYLDSVGVCESLIQLRVRGETIQILDFDSISIIDSR